MAKNPAFSIPASSIRHALICLAAVTALVLLALYPNMRFMRDLKQRIQDLEIETMKQGLLRPVYSELDERSKERPVRVLAFPKRVELGRDRVGELIPVFADMATRSGLKLVSLVPDVNSLSADGGFFSMKLQLQGEFFPLRDFLVEMGKMPYLEHIEEMELLAVKTNREYTLKVWMAVSGLPAPDGPAVEPDTDASSQEESV